MLRDVDRRQGVACQRLEQSCQCQTYRQLGRPAGVGQGRESRGRARSSWSGTAAIAADTGPGRARRGSSSGAKLSRHVAGGIADNVDGVRPRPSWPNEGRCELLVNGVSRIVSGSGSGGGVGDRGVESVQDIAAAGADPVVSAAASAVAGVGLARGWHVVISIRVLGLVLRLVLVLVFSVAVATALLPAMGSRWWRLHCSSRRHVCSADDGDADLGEGGRGLLKPRAGKRKGGNISSASSTAASRAANRAIQTAHYQPAGWRAKASRATKATKQAGNDMRWCKRDEGKALRLCYAGLTK